MQLNQALLKHPGYNPNALLDIVIKKLELKNDAALARLLRVAPPVISKTRSRALVVGPNLALRIMEATDITPSDLYQWMGVA
jgi:DNA-binding transcriptional regulator YdaS (Cro superfamily)